MNPGAPAPDQLLRNVQTGLLAAVAAFPLWPLKTTTLFIIAWLVSLLPGIRFNSQHHTRSIHYLILFTLPFLLYALSLFYDPMKQAVYFILEKKLSLIAVPLVVFFCGFKPDRKQWNILNHSFLFSIVAVVLWVNVAVFFFSNEMVAPGNIYFTFVYRKLFEAYSGIHPTYMGLFIFFGIFLNFSSLSALTWKINKPQMIWRLLLFLILLSAAVMLGARAPLFIFMITMFIYLIMHFGLKRKTGLMLALFSLLVVISVILTPAIRSRLVEFRGLQWRPPVFQEQNTANIRIGIYTCSVELLKSNWLTGVGPGSLQVALNNCYSLYPTDIYKDKDFNTHNEFFNSWLSLGIAGFLLFTGAFLIPLRNAWNEKQELYVIFLLLFFGCCLTENLLSRQMGIVFYALFNSLFAFAPPQKD